jgi:hypothetical protein
MIGPWHVIWLTPKVDTGMGEKEVFDPEAGLRKGVIEGCRSSGSLYVLGQQFVGRGQHISVDKGPGEETHPGALVIGCRLNAGA